jgi:DNA-binding SARP family transcriptional activator
VAVSPKVRVNLINGFAVEMCTARQSSAVEGLPPSVQRLVAHVSLAGRPGRAAIAGRLWPDVTEDQAQGSLRSVLWKLKKAVPGLVDAAGGAVRLADGVAVDVHEFDVWALRALDPGVNCDAGVTPAAALNGELLPGWYDDWVLLERERIRQLRMHALERLAEKLAGRGRFGEAVLAASAAVVAEPLRESAHRALVNVHLAEGNIVEALRVYETYCGMVADELGVLPTRLLEELVAPFTHGRQSERHARR